MSGNIFNIDFDKLFKRSSPSDNKIPGITMDSDSSSDSTSVNVNKNDEYIPTCPNGKESPFLDNYIPQKKTNSPKDSQILEMGNQKYTPKTPSPISKTVSRKKAIDDEKNTDTTDKNVVDILKKTKTPIKRRNSIPTFMDVKKIKNNSIKNEKPPAVGQAQSISKKASSNIEIRDNVVILRKLEKKNTFDINIGIPLKYFNCVVPIFHKGLRVDLFVKRSNEDTLWATINVKNIENITVPVDILKIVNIDEKIIKNLNFRMNNTIKFTESILSEDSDKNFKIFKESGLIRIGQEETNSNQISNDKNLYANARIELKKNITYIFELSLNVIFTRNYVNVYSENYRCNLYCQKNNNYLVCLVINVMNHHIIENGDKLMQNTLSIKEKC